jgi:hypothetical protein
MPGEKTNINPQDERKVNIHEENELDYWTKQFGVTADQLRAAVDKVGVSVAAVERELRSAPPI